ncbi:MAG: hypothetical protein UX71_C0010G0006 [Parcubacteria group bacterium GW2011_GWA1_47_10]|nr:MAG: hypothetical protein UX71_C0010G0006 [Parcubacteria group bacterium GW2011_GWA1_47_10]
MPQPNSSKLKKRIGKGLARKVLKFKSKVIVWSTSGDDKGAWRFARVPEKISAKIKDMQKGRLRRGWGAVYARAKIGKSEWVTSVFPDRHSATYILPLKKQIRYQENLYDGTDITVAIEIWF